MASFKATPPRCVAIIQSRMGSSRLPGKSIADVGGKPMICQVLNRVLSSKSVDQVVLATSTLEKDEPLAKVCTENGYQCFRGSEDDVLDRFYHAAKTNGAQICVRICGDCPLIDPLVIDQCVEKFHQVVLFFPLAHPIAIQQSSNCHATFTQLPIDVLLFF